MIMEVVSKVPWPTTATTKEIKSQQNKELITK